MEGRGALFREIHKNTWLKRLPIDNKRNPGGIRVSCAAWRWSGRWCVWMHQHERPPASSQIEN